MTEEHEGMAADLLTGVIPALWQKQSFLHEESSSLV